MIRYAVLQTCTSCTVESSAAGHRRFAYPVLCTSSLDEAHSVAARLRVHDPSQGAHRFDVAELKANGWPFCPFCEEDELYSLERHPSVWTIVGCYRCSPNGYSRGERNVREAQR